MLPCPLSLRSLHEWPQHLHSCQNQKPRHGLCPPALCQRISHLSVSVSSSLPQGHCPPWAFSLSTQRQQCWTGHAALRKLGRQVILSTTQPCSIQPPALQRLGAAQCHETGAQILSASPFCPPPPHSPIPNPHETDFHPLCLWLPLQTPGLQVLATAGLFHFPRKEISGSFRYLLAYTLSLLRPPGSYHFLPAGQCGAGCGVGLGVTHGRPF